MRKSGRTFVMMLSICLLSACAQGRWTRPNTTQAEFQQDMRECAYEAEKYGHVDMWGETGVGAGIEEGLRMNKLKRMCMENKGYYLQR